MAEQDDKHDDLKDEYQFADLDELNPGVEEDASDLHIDASTPGAASMVTGGNNTRRNAVIAVVGFLAVMMLYKWIGSYFGEKPIPVEKPAPALEVKEPPPPVVEVPESQLAPTPVVAPTSSASQVDMKAAISTLQDGQQNLDAQLTNYNAQLSNVSANVQTLSDKISEMNQTIASLNAKLEASAQAVERLSKAAPKVVHRRVMAPSRPVLHYNIQAVIPGRAWLIAENGKTVTVREGSMLRGYGYIKTIDAVQGRVGTSSGRVIRFSQEDN